MVIYFNVRPSFDETMAELVLKDDNGIWRLSGKHGNVFKDAEIDKKISNEDAKSILNKLQKVSIQPMPEFAMGLDGTTHEIIIENGFNKSAFTWWSKAPKQFKELEHLLKKILNLAQK